MSDSKFYHLSKMFELQEDIRELAETNKLLKRIKSKYDTKRGNKRLVNKLTQAQESLNILKDSLEKSFDEGVNKNE